MYKLDRHKPMTMNPTQIMRNPMERNKIEKPNE
jgi:hypothetical protein